MAKQYYDSHALIDAAWRMPELAKWKPDEKNTTATITIRPKARPSGLILPPRLRGPIEEPAPAFLVTFECQFGTVEGKPAFQIVGECRGAKKVVHQGFCVERPV